MKTVDDTVTLDPLGIQDALQTPLPLARRIVLHWVMRFLLTWFGFGLMTAAVVTGLQAMSVELSSIVTEGLLSVCALLAVFAVTGLIERRKLVEIGLGWRR